MKAIFLILLFAASLVAQTTRTVCASGCDFTSINAAIDASSCGDTIVPTAGQTFTETLVLDYKGCSGTYITIQSSALASLPAAGNRVALADASDMPLIRSGSAGATRVIETVSGANPSSYYKLIGLNIARHNSTSQQTTLVQLGATGSTQDTEAEMPSNITIDRCLIQGADNAYTRRGVQMDVRDSEVINSYIYNFYENGSDSQAIAAWNGGENILIANNFLEGASENLLVGGSDPSISNFVPNNWTVEHNHFFKNPDWRGDSPDKQVKFIFELKNAQNFTIQYNIFENNWAEAENGRGIHFSNRNQDGSAPWSTVRDITFRYNIVKNVAAAMSFLLNDPDQTSLTQENFDINNNLFVVSGTAQGGPGTLILFGGGNSSALADNYSFDHNTFINLDGGSGNRLIDADGTAGQQMLTTLSLTNNLTSDAGRLAHDGTSGEGSLDSMAGSSWVFTGNVLRYTSTGAPAGNFFPANITAIGFENYAGGDYSLDSGSTYKGIASGGLDPGVNWAELLSRTDEVVAGTNYGSSSIVIRYFGASAPSIAP